MSISRWHHSGHLALAYKQKQPNFINYNQLYVRINLKVSGKSTCGRTVWIIKVFFNVNLSIALKDKCWCNVLMLWENPLSSYIFNYVKPRNTEHLQCSPGVSVKSCITAERDRKKKKKENKAKLIMMVEPTSSRRVLLQYWWDLNRNRVWILCSSVWRLRSVMKSLSSV